MKICSTSRIPCLKKYIYSRINISSKNCWEWMYCKSPRGYGQVTLLGEKGAHRVAYRVFIGEIPIGMYVCHTCDNTSCVNPEHLFLGTQKDNMLDASNKGHMKGSKGLQNGKYTKPEKTPRGEKHGRAKLSLKQVKYIKTLKLNEINISKTGRYYGVTGQTIRGIITRRIWKHI